MAETEKRKKTRRTLVGVVTRDSNKQTRRVEISRQTKHARYDKYIKTRTVCYVHDEKDDSHKGDTVEIVECRPMSRTKRWRLVRIVERAPATEEAVGVGENR
jgi:small subunit ribosomal protein S17